MKVLVTGAAGRIGRTLALGLRSDFHLRLADIHSWENTARGELVTCNVTDLASVRAAMSGIEAVIHLAGHPNSRDWEVLQPLNIGGMLNVLRAAAEAGVRRVLYASSIHVCGLHPAMTLLSDCLPIRPDSPYGLSKAVGETMLAYFAERWSITGVAMRICSFRPTPTNARELATWISPADMVRLVEAGLTTSATGYHAIWGVSANSRARVEDASWTRLGYKPQDNAETHASRLAEEGVDTKRVSEWPLLGGAFADDFAGHSGALQGNGMPSAVIEPGGDDEQPS